MVLAEDLRQAVLQAALQGKLTEQLETDSNVDEMLINIKKEKEKLIADKKIKKEKPIPEIRDEDIPFEIPDSWRWVRLQSFLDVRDGTHDSPKYVENGIPFVTSKNLNNGKIDFSDVKYITKEDADFFNARSKVDKNDILMAMIGSIGKPVLVDIEQEFAIKNMALFKPVPKSNINMNYVLLLLEYAENIMKIQSTGGVQKFVSLTYLREFMSPLPPIEEQQRIVDRINEIMIKIDEYVKIEKELETLKKEFPTNMRDALLQAAMQGKLTEQLKSDSSVDELLVAIKKEKEELIAQKKIKKEKSLPDIEEEEIPFDIPENWRWVKLYELGEIVGGGTPKTSQAEFWNNGNISWITPADMNGCGRYIKKGEKSITQLGLDNSSAKLFPRGSVIMSSRAPIGYIAIAENEASTSQGCKTFSAYLQDLVLSEFIYYSMQFRVPDMEKRATGTTFKEISGKGVGETIIPFPPIEEQHRIVERLDALLPLCGDLKEE